MFKRKKSVELAETLKIAEEAKASVVQPVQGLIDLCSQFEGLFGKDVAAWDLLTIISFMTKMEEIAKKGRA